MRHRLKLTAILLSLLQPCGALIAQDDLGERVYFDVTKVLPERWEKTENMNPPFSGKEMILQSRGGDSGWVSAPDRLPFNDQSVLEIGISEIRAGKLIVQAEWFKEDDTFIAASELYNSATGKTGAVSRRLSECLPREEMPAKFRLKFWVEGKGADIRLSRILVRGPRGWRKSDTQTIRTYGPADVGIRENVEIGDDPDDVIAVVGSGTKMGNFVYSNMVYFNSSGALMIDLESIYRCKMTVMALCWNDRGVFLKEVPLLQDIAAPGLYETALKEREPAFPADTAQLSFKIWLEGENGTIRLKGLYYGVGP